MQEQINTLEEGLANISKQSKDSPEQVQKSPSLAESKKSINGVDEETVAVIDEKLNQFEKDVNETLKLLYEDV